MKHLTQKLCTAFCCLALLGSLLPAVTAAPATVHATAWLWAVHVDGVEASFMNMEGESTYLFSLGGSVYMPANIAATWLGCKLNVSQSGTSATFTSGEKTLFPGRNSCPDLTKEGLARLNRYFDQGVDVQPITGFSVNVDGKAWTFSGGKNPFFVDGTLYLPLRDVGARLGKDVLWVPAPVSTDFSGEYISIHTRPTQAQLKELQAFLDQGFGYYRQAAALAQELADAKQMAGAKAAEKLSQYKAFLRQIENMPNPSHPFFLKFEFYNDVPNITYGTIDEITREFKSGKLTLQEYRSSYRAEAVDITLMGRYKLLDFAQQALNVLVAALNGH